MNEQKMTDEQWFEGYVKAAKKYEDYAEQLGWGGKADANVEKSIEFDRRLIAYVRSLKAEIHRLQEENGYLKICADEFLAGHNQAQRELEDQEKRIKEMLTKILGFCTDKEVGMIYLIKRTAKEYGVEL